MPSITINNYYFGNGYGSSVFSTDAYPFGYSGFGSGAFFGGTVFTGNGFFGYPHGGWRGGFPFRNRVFGAPVFGGGIITSPRMFGSLPGAVPLARGFSPSFGINGLNGFSVAGSTPINSIGGVPINAGGVVADSNGFISIGGNGSIPVIVNNNNVVNTQSGWVDLGPIQGGFSPGFGSLGASGGIAGARQRMLSHTQGFGGGLNIGRPLGGRPFGGTPIGVSPIAGGGR